MFTFVSYVYEWFGNLGLDLDFFPMSSANLVILMRSVSEQM